MKAAMVLILVSNAKSNKYNPSERTSLMKLDMSALFAEYQCEQRLIHTFRNLPKVPLIHSWCSLNKVATDHLC